MSESANIYENTFVKVHLFIKLKTIFFVSIILNQIFAEVKDWQLIMTN